ncbi:phosphoglycan beta 13 galactosyltransferase 6 (SCG6) [Leptomonas pyrrhocoris]|uniref:Phosphoglycan beta 13 galactosyltransferase 6 (SCG6) n=1 Tax=Leptomonas pyrrhocoris TaxID=157538 RepID=A0A0N0DRZ5_LEPPY|nr:phosphoglycan beta 13 galactosyltransferase 6 (SCG6) [Leptomonas pyrrhocoris]KPA74881.1 phosphoglycan beta 13 galactosyltransferase 6 (SCG6) [Leptomonas pyrrhocoris]|eukprot:XP_015653320.1 phosphoglycan beta 13 galactosyltransferase 6 (SCG6) [Leptomonas pyrrhocoris]
MRRSQLPSWTLRVVDALCDECLDNATHAAAVARQLGASTASADGALPAATVFATPSAPLGLAGPMLFAMASVTDGVAVGAELARWSWVLRSYAVRRQFRGASPVGLRGGTSPYLVVLGIPSTDQPVRSSLRDAQRDTWLSYAEVARSGNDFRGALLPLYIFAAAEREQPHAVLDVSPLLPTVAEYEAASAVLLRPGSAAGAVRSYAERRVRLAVDVGAVGAGDALLAESPCAAIVSRPATPAAGTGADATWLSQLASALALPVRPAAVAAAEFVCGASTALWQEALAHRNMVWVDMMTDRRPSSKKKLGEGGNWGLPVEVGMTQKTVLWLEYAYHAFPDVPYIMKGDDDTYLKVPQFMSDVRYMRAGFKGKRVRSPPEVRDAVGVAETEECIYWGSWMRGSLWNYLRYHEGSGYMLHRRLVQVVLEATDRLNAEAVHLAVTPYNESLKEAYEALVMDVEDAYVGRVLRDRRDRIREVCPFHRATYVEEDKTRHFDLDNYHWVRYFSVLMHHVSPSDQYFLQYFFRHEHAVAALSKVCNDTVEKLATAAARRWMAFHVPHNLTGYNKVPKVRWTYNMTPIDSFVSPGDNVSVYSLPYVAFAFDALDKAVQCATPTEGV